MITVLYGLNNLPDNDFIDAFAKISKGSTVLRFLPNTSLDMRSIEVIKLAFQQIPPNIKKIILRGCFLNIKSGKLLQQFLAALPKTITAVDLSNNQLNWLVGADLSLALTGLRAEVSFLDLSSNGLGVDPNPSSGSHPLGLNISTFANQIGTRLATSFSTISPSVTTLILDNNNLGYLAPNQLITALAGIPHSVNRLSLRKNALHVIIGQLKKIFANIPAGVKSLNIGENELGNCSDLAQALSAIPSQVKELSVSTAELRLISIGGLIKIGKALPNVLKINLYNTNGEIESGPILNILNSCIGHHYLNLVAILKETLSLTEQPFAIILQYTDILINDFITARKMESLDISRWSIPNPSELLSVLEVMPPEVQEVTLAPKHIQNATDEELIGVGLALPGVGRVKIRSHHAEVVKPAPVIHRISMFMGVDFINQHQQFTIILNNTLIAVPGMVKEIIYIILGYAVYLPLEEINNLIKLKVDNTVGIADGLKQYGLYKQYKISRELLAGAGAGSVPSLPGDDIIESPAWCICS